MKFRNLIIYLKFKENDYKDFKCSKFDPKTLAPSGPIHYPFRNNKNKIIVRMIKIS
jgi:hypothetical protein